MSQSLAALAALVGGELRGPAGVDVQSLEIDGAHAIESAKAGQITFLADRSNLRRLENTQASALVVAPAEAEHPLAMKLPCIVVAEPQVAFVKIVQTLRPTRARPKRGVSPQAWIDPTATVGPDCWIAAGVSIGPEVRIGAGCEIHPGVVIGAGCVIGQNTTLYPNAVFYHDVIVGDRVIVHANAVIGADGFGYRFVKGTFEKIPQLGWVELHDDCEIGAGATVDRGAVGATIIGRGTKIDNMVMIAHNCEIGQHNVFASQVGLAGSCITGDYVRLGGQVGVKDHVTLNSGCSIGAKGGVHKDVPAGETWIGYPATPEAEQKRLVFSLKRVPEMRDEFREMKAQITALQSQLAALQGAPQAKAA